MNNVQKHNVCTIIIIIIISGVGLCPLGTAATCGLLYKPQMIDEDDCGAIGGMRLTKLQVMQCEGSKTEWTRTCSIEVN
jgi:hypothetical protein